MAIFSEKRYPENEVSIDRLFPFLRSKNLWEINIREIDLSDYDESITLMKDGIKTNIFSPKFSLKYRTITYKIDKELSSINKIEFHQTKFNPIADETEGSISIGEYVFIIVNCYYYNLFLAFLKEADEQFEKGDCFSIKPINAEPFYLDITTKNRLGVFIDPYISEGLTIENIIYIELNDYNDIYFYATGDFLCHIQKSRDINQIIMKGCIADIDEYCKSSNSVPAWPKIDITYHDFSNYLGEKKDWNGIQHNVPFYSICEHWELCGDPESCTLYILKNKSHLGGWKIKTCSVEDYYRLGEWIDICSRLYAQVVYAKKENKNNHQTDINRKASAESIKPHRLVKSPIGHDFQTSELDSLIGLSGLKKDVRELINLVKLQKARQARGLKSVPVSLHLVFTGNPGTGKTTVARILAKIYKEIGVLSKGQLVEVDRSGLVAGYVGQTAIKTQEKIDEAIGGVLFIDEAYTLVKEGNDFGQEAIDTILKAMEDNRDDFIVIVAGYPELMTKFINSNPGLKSRFNKYFNFPDYNADELEEIFDLMCREYDYYIDADAKNKVRAHLDDIYSMRDTNYANARDVRNFFERIVANQASRIMNESIVSDDEMMTIRAIDIDV